MKLVKLFIIIFIIQIPVFSFGQGKITRPEKANKPTDSKVCYRRIDELSDHLAFRAAGSNGKWGVMDRNNNLILPVIYAWVQPFHENRSYVQKTKDGKCALINYKGEFLTGYDYDAMWGFYEGRILVSNRMGNNGNHIFGALDSLGNMVIPMIYSIPKDGRYVFRDGKLKVSLNGNTFYIDKNGNKLSE